MATKKQKREAAQAKHEAFMEERRLSGLAHLEKERARRAHKEREEWRDNHEKNHSWQKRIKECPLCQDEIKAAKKVEPLPSPPTEASVEEAAIDLSRPQTGQFPDVDYGPTSDMELQFSNKGDN